MNDLDNEARRHCVIGALSRNTCCAEAEVMLEKEYTKSHTQHVLTTAVDSTMTDFKHAGALHVPLHCIFDLSSAEMTRTRRGSLRLKA